MINLRDKNPFQNVLLCSLRKYFYPKPILNRNLAGLVFLLYHTKIYNYWGIHIYHTGYFITWSVMFEGGKTQNFCRRVLWPRLFSQCLKYTEKKLNIKIASKDKAKYWDGIYEYSPVIISNRYVNFCKPIRYKIVSVIRFSPTSNWTNISSCNKHIKILSLYAIKIIIKIPFNYSITRFCC